MKRVMMVCSLAWATGLLAGEVKELGVGDAVPDVTVRTAAGESVALKAALGGRPTVLVFYRGGWCPYCNTHLGALNGAKGELGELGFKIVGISPDRPEELRKSTEKLSLDYRLLSDSSVAAARAFGIAFEVDAGTREKYKGYGIDLEQATGETHWNLPKPAAYLVDEGGVIRFASVNAEYKTRIEPEALLKAAREVAGKEPG